MSNQLSPVSQAWHPQYLRWVQSRYRADHERDIAVMRRCASLPRKYPHRPISDFEIRWRHEVLAGMHFVEPWHYNIEDHWRWLAYWAIRYSADHERDIHRMRVWSQDRRGFGMRPMRPVDSVIADQRDYA